MQAALNLDYINVYASNGQQLLHLGGTRTEGIDGGLVADAILGHDGSGVGASESGLVIAAASAVSGSTGTAGVLVVGTTLPAASLRDLPSAEDVAVYRAGRLVDTSIEDPDVRHELEQPIGSIDEVGRLNVSLAPLDMRAAGLTLSPGNFVLAMVPIDDLDRSSQQRTTVVIGGTLALVIALVLIALIQARAVARPLEKLVVVAGALVRGEYRRVEPSGNYEVYALGQAVNHLGDQLERKLAELTTRQPTTPCRVCRTESCSATASKRHSPAALAPGWQCSSWTWTASKSSTTASVTPPAIG